ncbi:cell wall-binding repeat-containing protein [Romboutsia sp. 1001216sp1]|uniref:cell wall-binding repeat-containing protein n=1 Tax=Romboutsia sp. 1001216sp1 TaxID=2986997 RepID=UPI00232EBE11|nr:cell wall-binding repeat-containing protein [Romboutsia sp. 1001216sp1]MDB8789330.1 cell wall-binding repeat-containing protein [Romboutsia sp. 1001216sp1]
MLKKKNIAMAMAAATAVTAVAPAGQVFADVIGNSQKEVKELKEKIYAIFNARYTENHNLLSNKKLAGKTVYESVTIENVGTYKNYAEFEKAFDKQFGKMLNGDVIRVEYTSENGAKKLDDGQYVDSKSATYSLTTVDKIPNTGDKLTDAQIKLFIEKEVATVDGELVDGLTGYSVDGTPIDKNADVTDAKEFKVNVVEKKLSAGYNEDNTTFVNVPLSEGYIKVENGSTKLDFSKPKFKVVDGYYVNAKGENIKKFIQSEELVHPDFITELKDGVVEGYYPVIEGEADKDHEVIAITKKAEASKKENLKVSDIYEASTGRLTKKGNEIVKAIYSMIHDEALKVNEDNLRGTLYTINKAGDVVDKLYTDKTPEVAPRSAEEAGEKLAQKLKVMLDAKEVETVKFVVESTTDETATNPAAEWTPIYEATITEGRNENFEDMAVAFAGLNKMPVLAGLDRYETAVETSKVGWANGAKEVVLVSGESSKLVDGLTATPLAATMNGISGAPVLLTKANELPKQTAKELVRLGAEKVTIVGGKNSVSDEVVKVLKETYGIEVERLGGTSRYETSMAVANKIASNRAADMPEGNGQNSAKFDYVFVVGGKGEADALSASAMAGEKQTPILLTPAGDLDKDVKHFINKNVADHNNETDVFIVGGNSSVSPAVQKQLVDIEVINNEGNHIEVKRLAGDGRQETNAAVIEQFRNQLPQGVVVAKSDNKGMIDALSAGAFAAAKDAHIVLATNKLVEEQEDALAPLKDKEDKAFATTKAQVGYGIGASVIQFVNGIFKR